MSQKLTSSWLTSIRQCLAQIAKIIVVLNSQECCQREGTYACAKLIKYCFTVHGNFLPSSILHVEMSISGEISGLNGILLLCHCKSQALHKIVYSGNKRWVGEISSSLCVHTGSNVYTHEYFVL